jgi:hypothetical protein
VLPRILEVLTEPALFWLDAHPGTNRSARDAPIPLRAELAAIRRHPVGGHVVLVDDLKYLGTPGYPTLAEIALPGYRIEEADGVAVLTPASRA